MTKAFFVPLAKTPQEQEALYRAMRETLHQAGHSLSEERILGLHQFSGGEDVPILVGRPHPDMQEVVMGIFRDSNQGTYYIFTPSRGLWKGQPLALPASYVTRMKMFPEELGR